MEGKKKRAALFVVSLVMVLLLSAVLVGSGAADPGIVLLDSVNIGDTASESGHNLVEWSDIISGSVGNFRLIWGVGQTCEPENNWASLTLDAGTGVGRTLSMWHQDGYADDGFDVYINNQWVGTYVSVSGPNTWLQTSFDISSGNYIGNLTIKMVATAGAWAGCELYGQVAFDLIELWGEPVTVVEIDIKPGSYPNAINLRSKGKVPVAILTTADFDASSVDPVTVLFASASPLRWAMEDVDGDGDMDLLLHFKTQELSLDENSTEATLTGTILGGTAIQGSDAVNIVPKKK